MKKRLRFICASAVAYLLITFGFTRTVKKKALRGDFILSIYFHAPDKYLFEFCVTWLKHNKFHFLSQEDLLLIADKRTSFPKGGVIITVDDGWQSNEENIVAIANKHEVQVTIFVASDPVEKGNFWWPYIDIANRMKLTDVTVEYLKRVPNNEREEIVQNIRNSLQLDRQAMTINQIENISKSKYITIGSHTVTHPILINCYDKEVNFELEESKKRIESWIKKEVVYFAYPNGDYGEREKKHLKNIGYSLAYSTNPLYLTKDRLENKYELPRFEIFGNISKAEARCRMLGVWQRFF